MKMTFDQAKAILENANYAVEDSNLNESTEESTNRKCYRNYLDRGSSMTWEEFGKLAFKALTENQIGLLIMKEMPHIHDDPSDGIRLRYLRQRY